MHNKKMEECFESAIASLGLNDEEYDEEENEAEHEEEAEAEEDEEEEEDYMEGSHQEMSSEKEEKKSLF